MSELQISLIALGAIAVFGIWIYNKWQETRLRRAAEKVFQGQQADALLSDEAAAPVEPIVETDPIKSEPESEPPASDDAFERIEPTLPETVIVSDTEPYIAEENISAAAAEVAESQHIEPTLSAPEAAVAPAPAPVDVPVQPSHSQAAVEEQEIGYAEPPQAWCDPIVDFVVTLALPEDTQPAAISALLPTTSKTLRCLALAPDAWVLPELDEHTAFRVFRICLQLVDRRGAIAEDELVGFVDAMHKAAEKFAARIEMPAVDEMLVQARAIDDFCAQLDLCLSINVVDPGKGAFPGTKLRGLAEAAGFRLNANGVFQYDDEDGQLLFILSDLDGQVYDLSSLRTLTTHGISFSLDVPRVSNGPQAYDRMLMIARQMAQSLGGQLANAQRAPLADATISAIRARVVEIQKIMGENQIPAGGVRALRLFF